MSLGAETGTQGHRPEKVALRARGLSKLYPPVTGQSGGLSLFRQLDLDVLAGEMVAIIGRSGAGKSSLLHLLAGLDQPTAGEVWIGETALHTLNTEQSAVLRNRAIGYVWQFHYLLPEFSALENVALPLMAGGRARREAEAEAQRWLERVGLGERAKHRSGELSGGEQQRVALARALAPRPLLLLADEPTGDLDDETAATLFALVKKICREEQLATLLVTHNIDLAKRCDRVLRLSEGRLEVIAA